MSRISATICLLLLGVLGSSMASINLPTNQQDFILRPETTYLFSNCQGTELKPFYDGDVLSHVEMDIEEQSCVHIQLHGTEQQDRQLDDVWTIECGLTLVYIGHNAESSQVVGLAYC